MRPRTRARPARTPTHAPTHPPTHAPTQALSPLAVAALLALKATGYAFFRGANSQKDLFRRDPSDPRVAHLRTLPTARGTRLIVSGWWGVARHVNYLGDWLMGWAWCLPTGFQSIIPYFYVAYFGVLLGEPSARALLCPAALRCNVTFCAGQESVCVCVVVVWGWQVSWGWKWGMRQAAAAPVRDPCARPLPEAPARGACPAPGPAVHRDRRDEAACRQKYGKDWDKYCSIVRYRLIPGIY